LPSAKGPWVSPAAVSLAPLPRVFTVRAFSYCTVALLCSLSAVFSAAFLPLQPWLVLPLSFLRFPAPYGPGATSIHLNLEEVLVLRQAPFALLRGGWEMSRGRRPFFLLLLLFHSRSLWIGVFSALRLTSPAVLLRPFLRNKISWPIFVALLARCRWKETDGVLVILHEMRWTSPP
jgi:hypothetical protein